MSRLGTIADLPGLALLQQTPKRRYALTDPITPEFEQDFLEHVRAMPPEAIENSPHGALQWALELLDLPRNLAANVLNQFVGATPTSKTRAFGLRKVSGSDLLKGLGLSLGDDYGTAGKVADWIAGFGTDVLTDPLSYLTLGTSSLLGTGAKQFGKVALKKAGVQAVEKELGALTGRVAERATQRALSETPELAAKLGQEAVDSRLYERLGRWGQRSRDAATGVDNAWGRELGTSDLARAFQQDQGRQRVSEILAERVAKETPDLVDKNLATLSTKPLREFHPLDLPAGLAGVPAAMVAPKLTEQVLAPAYRAVREVTRPLLAPWTYLPEVTLPGLTTDMAAQYAQRLGLPKLWEPVKRAVQASPSLSRLGEGLAEIPRELQRRFSTTPVKPRSGDLADQRRYEGEIFEKFVNEEVARRARTVAAGAVEDFRGWQQQAQQQLDLPPDAFDKLSTYLTEAYRAETSPEELAAETRKILAENGAPPDLAERIVVRAAEQAPQKVFKGGPQPQSTPTAQMQQEMGDVFEQGAGVAQGSGFVVQGSGKTGSEAELLSPGPLKNPAQNIPKSIPSDPDAALKAFLENDTALAAPPPSLLPRVEVPPVELPPRVDMGDTPQQVMARLRQQFPKANKRAFKALLDASPEYAEALKRQRVGRMQEGRAAGKAVRQEALTAAQGGEVSERTLVYAPLHELPQVVRRAIQSEAEYLLDDLRRAPGARTTGRQAREQALERIIIDAGKDVGAAVEKQKARIVSRLSGDQMDAFGQSTRTFGEMMQGAWHPGDPLIATLLEQDPAQRAARAAAAIQSVQAGEPDALAQTVEYYLTRDVPEPGYADIGDADVLEFLEALRNPKPKEGVRGQGAGISGQLSEVSGQGAEVNASPGPLGVSPATAGLPNPPVVGPQLSLPGLEGHRLETGVPVGAEPQTLTPEPLKQRQDVTLGGVLQEVVDTLNAREGATLARELQAGVPAKQLTTRRQVQYIRRMLGDAKSPVGALLRRGGMMTTRAANQNIRGKFREKFITEANRAIDELNRVISGEARGDPALWAELQTLGIKPNQLLSRYSEDPRLAYTVRELESARTVGSAQFVTELMSRYGVAKEAGKGAPAGYASVTALHSKFAGLVQEHYVPTEVAALLEKHLGQFQKPDLLLKAYDKLLGGWKGLALLAPAYHLRNLFGNVWNASLGGGFDLGAWAEARDILRRVAAGKGLEQGVAGTPYTAGELHRGLQVDAGLLNSGFFGTEFSTHQDAAQKVLAALENPSSLKRVWREITSGSALNRAQRANLVLGGVFEDASKLGFVLTRLRAGDDLPTAVAGAKRYLFDYADVTSFERGVMRRIMPFYAWTRKNAELLLQTAFTEPAKLALLPKVQLETENQLAGQDTLPPSLRPAHIQKEFGIQVSGGPRPVFVSGGYMLPVGELRALVDPLNFLKDQVGGPARIGAELALNRDLYFDQPIKDYPGQQKTLAGIPMSPAAKHILRAVRPLNTVEQAQRLLGSADTAAGQAAAVASTLTGFRTFPVDVTRQVLAAERTLNEQLGAVKTDLRRRLAAVERAVGQGPQLGQALAADAEMRRLFALYQELLGQRDALPGKAARQIIKPLSQRRQDVLAAFMEQQAA